MKKILVAINESPSAHVGARYAAQLARATGSTLVLAYISPAMPFARPALAEQIMSDERTSVTDLLEDMGQALGVPYTTIHVRGHAVAEFLALAERPGSWLSVIGPKPRIGLGRLLQGGFAQRVARNADRHVLLARGDPNSSPLVAGSSALPPLYVVGCDGSDESTHAASEAATLARKTGASLHLVSVVEPVVVGPGVVVPGDFIAAQESDAEELVERIRRKVPEGLRCTTEVVLGPPGFALETSAQRSDAALIVVGRSGRGRGRHIIFGSTADHLANFAGRSVLVVSKHQTQGL